MPRVLVSSALRSTGTSSSFSYNLAVPISNASKCRLIDYVIPNASYVVNTYNNTTSYTYNSNTYLVVLPVGNYTSSSLAGVLQNALVSNSGLTFSVTYNSSLFQFQVTSSSPVSYNLGQYPLFCRLFGFSASNTSAVTSITSVNAALTCITPLYYLTISEIPYACNSSTPFTFVITNNVLPGDILTCTGRCEYPDIVFSPKTLGSITITLSDINGNQVALNGADIILILDIA